LKVGDWRPKVVADQHEGYSHDAMERSEVPVNVNATEC